MIPPELSFFCYMQYRWFLVSFNRDDLCNDACVMLYCLKAKKKYSFIINTKYPNDMQKKCTP